MPAKYFCKFCKIFVTENAISRSTHEAHFGHKAAVKRFLRDMERNEGRKAREDAMAKRLIDAVDRAAGLPPSSSGSSATPSTTAKLPPKSKKPTQETQGPPKVRTFIPGQDNDGFDVDNSAEEQQEAPVYIAVPGEWETVEEPVVLPTTELPQDVSTDDNNLVAKKRLLDLTETLEEEGYDEGGYSGRGGVKGFQLVEKTLDSVLEHNSVSQDPHEPSSSTVAFKKRKIKGSLRKK